MTMRNSEKREREREKESEREREEREGKGEEVGGGKGREAMISAEITIKKCVLNNDVSQAFYEVLDLPFYGTRNYRFGC